jgi:hypothetical protein
MVSLAGWVKVNTSYHDILSIVHRQMTQNVTRINCKKCRPRRMPRPKILMRGGTGKFRQIPASLFYLGDQFGDSLWPSNVSW